jgi:four helix bundle protein
MLNAECRRRLQKTAIPAEEWLRRFCLTPAGRAGVWPKNSEIHRGNSVADISNVEPPYDIQERTFVFAVQVVNFCRGLSDAHPVTKRLSWQLLDAATSTGANMEEADAGQSKRDFVSKTAIARKEVRESVYWLRLIAATDARCRSAVRPLLDEAKQIAAIISAIKRNAESNPNRAL